MHRLGSLILVPLFAALACANDPLQETKSIDEQIKALDQSPVALEMNEISRRADEAGRQANEAREKAHAEIQALQATDAYKAYHKERESLRVLREATASAERTAIAEAARKLYSARHDELRGRVHEQPNAGQSLGLDVLTYPRIAGSTSTQPLATVIACRTLGVPYEWLYPEPTGYRGARAVTPPEMYFPAAGMRHMFPESEDGISELSLSASKTIAKPATDDVAETRKAMLINSLLIANRGTHESYLDLIQGKADLLLAARAPSADELRQAEAKGVTLDAQPLAHDALVFLVNHKSPIKGLTLDEIRTLYRKALSRDDQPSGEDALIPYMRDHNSGSRELFDTLVMRGEALPEPENPHRHRLYLSSMAGPYNRITTEPRGLGYSVYYYERYMALSPYTRTIAIDGVEPTSQTIASGTYPLVAPVFVVRRHGLPADAPASRLMAWLLSEEGQAIVRESGYVPARR